MKNLKDSKILVLIPSRFASSRFPGKPLAMIKGKTMIQRVFENISETHFEVCVITDDSRIEQHVLDFGGNVKRIDDGVGTGSERIALAYQRFFQSENYDAIVNVQGDEPLLKSETLKKLVTFHLNHPFSISTLLKERTFDIDSSTQDNEDFNNPHIVKVSFACETGKCLYFSRSSIPYRRDDVFKKTISFTSTDVNSLWYQHIGVYCYDVNALMDFVNLPESRLESMEKLEQLRALENNMSIGAITTNDVFVGVDVPDDIQKVEKYL